MKKIIAVLDIGSNSIVLLVAKCDSNGNIEPINEVIAFTRLGEGVNKTRNLSEKTVNHTLQVAKEMQAIAEREKAEDLIVTAASAVRNAENRNEFLIKCHQQLNIFPQVLSEKDEAKFTHWGSTLEIESNIHALTIDIGGNSTEIAYGTKEIIEGAHSMDIGCISLTEMFNIGKNGDWLHQRIAAKYHIKRQLSPIERDVQSWSSGKNAQAIASGGTATAYGAILLKQPVYDRKQLNTVSSLTKEASVIGRQLSKMNIEKRRKIPGMEYERAEVLPAGLLILTIILQHFNFEKFRITTNGLRMGILKHYIRKKL